MSAVSRRSMLGLVLLVVAVSGLSQWWAGHSDRRLGREVAALAQPGDIHMVSSDTCAICWRARAWFMEHKVAFTECSVEKDADCRRAFDRHGAPGTPVMVVRGKPLLGFDPTQLQQVLRQRA